MRTPALVASLTLAAAAVPAQPALDAPRLFPAAARRPGVASVRWDAAQSAYLLALRDALGNVEVEYRLPLGHAHLARGVLRVEETTTGVVPIAQGGFAYRTAGVPAQGLGRLIPAWDLAFGVHDAAHTGTLLGHSLDPMTGEVTLRWRDEYAAGSTVHRTEKTFRLRLFGRALRVRATADHALRAAADYNYAGLQLGVGTGLPGTPQVVRVPYMDMVPVFAGGGVFVARWLDWYASNASETPAVRPAAGAQFAGETGSGYYRNDRGELNAPIDDTAWIVVSRAIADTFPVIDRPPSEYRLLAAQRAVSQNGPGNRIDAAQAWVARAASCGVHDMQHIKWDWHKWPFNLNDPDYIPAAPLPPFGLVWGSEAHWRGFARGCAEAGWGLALYVAADMMDPGYPDLVLQLPGSIVGSVLLTANPAYDASACTRHADGSLKKGWDTNLNLAGTNLAGRGHPVDVLGSQRFAANFAGYAGAVRGAAGFPTGGAHVDAQTDVPAWIAIDQIANSPRPKTIADNLRAREVAFQTLKDGLQGPLFGENAHWRYRAFESYAAGLLDGTSRKIPIQWDPATGPPDTPNWDAEVIPDYELAHVVPKAAAMFGMGWEYQYRPSGYPVTPGWSDGWHTTLLSYGHAAYFSTNGDVTNNYWTWRDTLRSYHLTRGLSAAMRASRVTAVRYVDGQGNELGLEAAIAAGLDLRAPRLVLRFANGVELKANHGASDWQTTVLGRPYTLPMDGFAGAAPDGLLALSAINPASGVRVDYARTPGVSEMIDRRGADQSFAGFPGALLPVPTGVFPGPVDDKQMTIVRDLRENQAVYATGFQTGRKALGPPPALVALRVTADDTTTLSLGRLRLGLRAIATDVSGSDRDLTGRVQWTSDRPDLVEVTRLGGCIARGAGRATITATLASPSLRASLGVDVTGLPVVSRPELAAQSSRATLLAFTTDTGCPLAAAIVQDLAVPSSWLVLATPDPAAKQHQVALTGLVSSRRYRVTAGAINALGLVALGPPFDLVAP